MYYKSEKYAEVNSKAILFYGCLLVLVVGKILGY